MINYKLNSQLLHLLRKRFMCLNFVLIMMSGFGKTFQKHFDFDISFIQTKQIQIQKKVCMLPKVKICQFSKVQQTTREGWWLFAYLSCYFKMWVIMTSCLLVEGFLYVPCPFWIWTIMSLHNFLSVFALSNSCSLSLWPLFCHPFTQIYQVSYYFSQFFLPSMCPVSVKFVKPSFVIICPQSFTYFSFYFLFDLKLSCFVHNMSMVRLTFIDGSTLLTSSLSRCYSTFSAI